jgi:hypothetical protein
VPIVENSYGARVSADYLLSEPGFFDLYLHSVVAGYQPRKRASIFLKAYLFTSIGRLGI